MKNFLLIFLLCFLITSCGTTKVNFEDIDYLFIDYDKNYPNNFTSEIPAKICIHTIYGEIVPIKKKNEFRTESNLSYSFSKGTALLYSTPIRFNDSIQLVDLIYTNSDGQSIRSMDTLLLNFKAPITIDYFAAKGLNGADGADGNTALLFRDGKSGDNGESGNRGEDGDRFIIHIWKENETNFIRVNNVTKSFTATYQVKGDGRFFLTSKGGSGGDGGIGGAGGEGKDGEQTKIRTKAAGAGGNGGSGGNGGVGGNGGAVLCLIHPSATDFKSSLRLDSPPGGGGEGGKAGTKGNAGKPTKGEAKAEDGLPGASGQAGNIGQWGNIEVKIEVFEIKKLN
jgi:hypothetical protein